MTPQAGASSACGVVPRSVGVDGGTGLLTVWLELSIAKGNSQLSSKRISEMPDRVRDPEGCGLACPPWTRSVLKSKAQRDTGQLS